MRVERREEAVLVWHSQTSLAQPKSIKQMPASLIRIKIKIHGQNSDVDHSRVDLIKFISSDYQSKQDLFILVTELRNIFTTCSTNDEHLNY